MLAMMMAVLTTAEPVGLIGVGGGVSVGELGVTGNFAFTAEAGARWNVGPGLGVVAVANMVLSPFPNPPQPYLGIEVVQSYGLGPGLRVGKETTHLTVGPAFEIIYARSMGFSLVPGVFAQFALGFGPRVALLLRTEYARLFSASVGLAVTL